jgi:hypothetical protein
MTRHSSHIGRKPTADLLSTRLPTLPRPKRNSHAFETAARASATVVESGVVGRPIRAESWAAVVEQRPVRRVGIPTGDGFCDRLGETESHKRRRIFGDWQILVRDGPACLPRNLGGEVRKRIGVVARELIRFAVVTCPGERGDGGLRVK